MKIWMVVIWMLCGVPAFSMASPPKRPAPVDRVALAEQVKAECQRSWAAYKKYAWGADALKPLSKTPRNWYAKSLLMTPVDAFDTLVLMGLGAEAAEAKELIFRDLSFDVDMEVQHFEIAIRILGGLLSAYELDGDPRFLRLATDLADRMLKVFDSPTGMPYGHVNLKTGQVSVKVSNPAEIGTYVLEYGILSRHTGNPIYYDKAMKAMRALFSRRSALQLTGSEIDVESGQWVDTSSHISGGIDSYLEYMLKGAILFGDAELAAMWKATKPAVDRYLSDHRASGYWYGQADMHTGQRTTTQYGALDAFYAGTLAMSGDLKRAAELQASNHKMWMLHGVEPETLDYSNLKVTHPAYVLRPENLEGAYYLYHYTHDEKYLRMGRDMWAGLMKKCRTDVAFAALKDVSTGAQRDDMESFFFAETLKYAYLLFRPEALDFDQVVFNTEAHPYRRNPAQEPPARLRGVPPKELARRIRENRDFDEVLDMARDLFKDRFNAGTVYPETWVRDFATFLDIALDRGNRGEIKETLRMFLRFQGADGNIPDGFTPHSEGRTDYQKILSPSAPGHWAHKNTVVTDQESSFILSVCTYVRRTGDAAFLDEKVDGKTVRERMLGSLDYLLAQRWSEKHGLLWGATTIDWGDVQPEHPWGTFLTKDTHRAVGIYNNAMLALALDSFLPLMGKEDSSRWTRVRADLRRAIRQHLWDAPRQKFRTHLYLDGSPFPAGFDEEAITFTGGTAMAMQAGLLEPSEVEASIATMRLNAREDGPFTTMGLVCHPVYPAHYFQNPDHQPHVYINGGDWPWISGRVIQAMIQHGFVADAYEELLLLAQRVKRDKGFFEWYDQAGKPHGAGQFRGAAGVTGLAIKQLQAWAQGQP